MDATSPFKRCSLCGHTWATRTEMLSDPEVSLVGYQAFSSNPEQGMLLFNHMTCKTTLALYVTSFQDLHHDPVHPESLAGTDECSGHCDSTSDLERCTNRCSGAWVREVLQTVKEWPKADTSPVS